MRVMLLRAELYAEGLGFGVEVVEFVAGGLGLLGFGGRLDDLEGRVRFLFQGG